jgi:hypothetical protein
MKQLSGSASAPTRAGEHRCVDFLSDVEAYPHWYPEVVRSVEVLERDADGRATRARATLRASVGPINRDLQLTLGVSRGPREVKLVRTSQDSADAERFSVNWQVSGAQSGARIDLKLDAALDVPRLVPLGGVGDAMASGFVAAAVRSLDRSAG